VSRASKVSRVKLELKAHKAFKEKSDRRGQSVLLDQKELRDPAV
jgi:hypothetical protein